MITEDQQRIDFGQLTFTEKGVHNLLVATQPAYKDLVDTCGPRSALVIARECPRLTDMLKSAQNVQATDQTRAVTDTFGKALYGRPDQARAIDKQLEQNPALARNFLDLYERNPAALQKSLPEIIDNPDRMSTIVAGLSTKPVAPTAVQQRPAVAMTVSMNVPSSEPAGLSYFSDVIARHPELKQNIEIELNGKPELNRKIADLAQKNPEALDAAKQFYVEKSLGYADVRERMQKARLDLIVDKAVKEPDFFPKLMSQPPTVVMTPPAAPSPAPTTGPTPAPAQNSPSPAAPVASGKTDMMAEMEKLAKEDPALADKAMKFATEVGMVGGKFRLGFEEFGQRVFKNPELKNSLVTALKGDNGGKVTEELKKNLKEHPDLFERMNEVIDRNPRSAKKMFNQIADGNVAGGIETFSSTVRMNAIVDGIADFLGMISPALGEKFRSFADSMRNSKYGEMVDGFAGKMINKAAGNPEPEKNTNTPAPKIATPAPQEPTPETAPEKLVVIEKPALVMLDEEELRKQGMPVYRDPTPEERRRSEEFRRLSQTEGSSLVRTAIRELNDPSGRIGERSGLESPVKREGGLSGEYNLRSQGQESVAPEPASAPAIRRPEQDDLIRKSGLSMV